MCIIIFQPICIIITNSFKIKKTLVHVDNFFIFFFSINIQMSQALKRGHWPRYLKVKNRNTLVGLQCTIISFSFLSMEFSPLVNAIHFKGLSLN